MAPKLEQIKNNLKEKYPEQFSHNDPEVIIRMIRIMEEMANVPRDEQGKREAGETCAIEREAAKDRLEHRTKSKLDTKAVLQDYKDSL